MTTDDLRAAEAQATEIYRLWDEEKLDGRRIAERLSLTTRAVNQLLRLTRSAPTRRSRAHLAGPRRIAALLWLHRMRPTTSIADLASLTGLSREFVRLSLREDLNQWSAAEKRSAVAQFPDPFGLSVISQAEQDAWNQVTQHEAIGPGGGSGFPAGCTGAGLLPPALRAPAVRPLAAQPRGHQVRTALAPQRAPASATSAPQGPRP